jgi:flagellar motility protein MotE (MotC chaperone)
MTKPRYLRLLPSVVLLGAGLLVLKTTDIVHAAYAEAGEQVAAITEGPVPSNKDYAGGDDDQVSSASEVDVMNSLAKRRRDLDARQGQLAMQANMIAATENRVDAKIAQLKQLQAQIAALLGQRDEAQKAQIAALVKTYSTMKAKDSARIFNSLPDEVLVPVAQQMKSDVLALVLANMNSDNAKALTVKLANRLTLPQTTDAVAPAAITPVPGPAAAAALAAAPVQTAAAAPAAAAKAPAPTPAAPEKSATPNG